MTSALNQFLKDAKLGLRVQLPHEVVVQSTLWRAIEIIEVMQKGLNETACWAEGPEVNSSFDSPGEAQHARYVLTEANKIAEGKK